MSNEAKVLRPPAEAFYAEELAALAKADREPRPPGWRLSPRAVRGFICGSKKPAIERKFFGDDVLVERAIVGLAGNRGLLLVGEPGTAKSMLSELLAAAISGCSTNTIQGTAGTTEDQIKYSWNYALLLAEGPSPKALVPGALHVGMSQGTLVRFEEITRCPPEIQDTLVSVLSDKLMTIPELHGDERVLLARPGFNVIATANIRDRGVHEMSSALKRRFNF
ncbi:MAG TPA: AAA family ATPase, partial [Pirellulales bacterium]